MALDWTQCAEVTRSPEVMSGDWVFRGTRLPVALVFKNIEGCISVDEIPEIYPGVTLEQVKAVMRFSESGDMRIRATPPAPLWLQQSWDTARQHGVDRLTADDIDAEIAAARQAPGDAAGG